MTQDKLLVEFNVLIERAGGNEHALSLINEKCFGMGPARRTFDRIRNIKTKNGKYKLAITYFLLKSIIDSRDTATL